MAESNLNKMVSIVMPTYNCGSYIAESIECVLSQTYKNWELIIVDDCSDDETEKIVAKYILINSKIVYYKLENNSGAAVARTKAIALSNGNYIAFLDSDDLWMPEKLEIQLKIMEENRWNFTSTACVYMDEYGDLLNKEAHPPQKADYHRVLLDCPVCNSTVMYNVDELGKFCVPNIRKRNDDALWLSILKKEKNIYGIDKILMKYRVRKSSLSYKKLNLIKYHWVLYRDIEHLSILSSCFHIGYWCVIKVLGIK